jgi:hypothetical protein
MLSDLNLVTGQVATVTDSTLDLDGFSQTGQGSVSLQGTGALVP